MIDPIAPELKGMCPLAIRDMAGHALTLHVMGGVAGMVMSAGGDTAMSTGVSIRLDRADRAALICALIEIQENEDIS